MLNLHEPLADNQAQSSGRWHAIRDAITLPKGERYFDKVQIWFTRRLTHNEVAKLAALCGGGVHTLCRRMRFQRQWVYRVQLRQPTVEAFRYLAAIMAGRPVMINYVEIAIDWCGVDIDALHETLDTLLVRKWWRRGYEIALFERTNHNRYDGPGRASNRTTFYQETHSRITGELRCLHFEWRAKRRGPVEKLGIVDLQSLVEFDHDAFWSVRFDKYLALYRVDVERLGRAIRNACDKTRDQSPQLQRVGWGRRRVLNLDTYRGEVAWRGCRRVQELIGEYGFRSIWRALTPLAVVFVGD